MVGAGLAVHEEKLRVALGAFTDVRLALVFGSQARGDATSGSDLDVAILGADEKLPEISAALSAASCKEVDVVSLRDPAIPLAEELLRDGKPLYERKPGLIAEWRSRTLATLETDRPWYARMRDAWLARVAREGL